MPDRLKTSLGIWALGGMITRFVPVGYQPEHGSESTADKVRRAVDGLGQTVVSVTHDPRAAAWSDRVLFLADGRIVDELRGPTADSVLERMKRLEA